MFSAFALPLIGAPLLLLPVHFVWLEVIVHPTSSLVFEADAGVADLMQRPPRRPDTDLLPRDAFLRAMADGGVLAVAVLAFYLYLLSNGLTLGVARGESIAAMIVGQTVLILLERRPGTFLWRSAAGAGVILPVIVAITLGGLWVALHVPAIAAVLQVAPLSAAGWGAAIAVGIASTIWREPFKALKVLRPSR